MKIKKGDNIIMISGKDKGKKGKVMKVLPGDNKIIVENINLKKKHQRPKTAGKKGEKIEVPRPVSDASAMLICSSCGQPARAGYKVLDNNLPAGKAGKKIRICKKCGSGL